MKKIPTLFVRPASVGRKPEFVIDEVVPDAAWVIAGEGIATRKYDGTCCMVKERVLYKRYDAKGKVPPPNFFPAEGPGSFVVEHHNVGWIPVGPEPDSKYHREAFSGDEPDGTYELCGPMVQGNPEGLPKHILIPHGLTEFPDCPRTFNEIREWLRGSDIEGIVWHHPDGRMAKVKKKDFFPGRKW